MNLRQKSNALKTKITLQRGELLSQKFRSIMLIDSTSNEMIISRDHLLEAEKISNEFDGVVHFIIEDYRIKITRYPQGKTILASLDGSGFYPNDSIIDHVKIEQLMIKLKLDDKITVPYYRDQLELEFLGLKIHNSGNSDGFVILRDHPYNHFGNYSSLKSALENLFRVFLILHPDEFSALTLARINQSKIYHEYFTLTHYLQAQKIPIPKWIRSSEDINFTIELDLSEDSLFSILNSTIMREI